MKVRLQNTEEGIKRFLCGQKIGVSTDISGTISYGYGDLSENGFWEFPVPVQMVEMKAKLKAAEEMARALKGCDWGTLKGNWTDRIDALVSAYENAGKEKRE